MTQRPLRILALVFLIAAGPIEAWASPNKLDARARAAWVRLRAGSASVDEMRGRGAAIGRDGALDVFIRGSVSRRDLEAAGARVRSVLPGLFTASLPAAAVARVAALPGVEAIRAGAPCQLELDSSVPTTGVQYLRGSGPGFAGLGGQGVLVGIVDSGIDFNHGDFKDSTGATRLVSIWDQTVPGTGPPGSSYPYGVEWTSAQINGGTCTEVDTDEHGTHAAGIAAGDGSQTGGAKPAFTYSGMAPRADLIVVKTDAATPDVIDAINYVFDKATLRSENAVVNLSLGTHYGSHDGFSEFEQGVSALVAPGHIVVKSAGNDRGTAVHAQLLATPGGTTATLSVSGSASARFFAIDGYYNATERLRVSVRTPNNTAIGPLVLNSENAPWPGQSTQNGDVYVAHDSLSNGRMNVYVEVNINGNQNMNGTWQVTLLADQLGASNGKVDLWRYLAASGVTADFVAGNVPTQQLITEPGNAANVVTVGAWVSKTSWTCCNGSVTNYSGIPAAGNLAPFSSPGPTRDGRQKPDLAAPGTAIASATSFDVAHSCLAAPAASELLNDGINHRVFQGTSMSAPHVTGAVAVLLQKFGAMTPAQVTSYLQTHARADGFTGSVPSKDWGYGKLNLGDLISPSVRVVSPNGGEQTHPGGALFVRWTATDSLGSVASVDLQLSRTGPLGPYETIALGVANTGSYGWAVTGPSTAPNAAFLRVVAHDTNANVGSDLSDAGFSIATPTGVGPAEPAVFALSAVGPNPASHEVRVEYSLAHASAVRLGVCDVQGREVAILESGIRPAGRFHAIWQANRGRAPVPHGLFFVRYDTPVGRFVRRVVVVR